jgi:ABC-type transport system substrate-binding protein
MAAFATPRRRLAIALNACGGRGEDRHAAEVLATLPNYGPDAAKKQAEARAIMQKLGYGPDNRLAVMVTTRNVPGYRDAAVLMIDQLKKIYVDATLDAVDTTQWYPKVMRKDYAVGLTVSENGLDDPTSNSMRISCAAPSAITPDTAITRSTHSSTVNQ